MKYTDFVNSIQGLVKVEATDEGITAIEFVSAAKSDNTANAKQGGIGRETAAQESVLSNDFHSQKTPSPKQRAVSYKHTLTVRYASLTYRFALKVRRFRIRCGMLCSTLNTAKPLAI